MKRSSYKIFSSGVIAGLTLKNRLVRAATFEGISSQGKVTDEILDLYRKLAEGGIGLIISGSLFATSPNRPEDNQDFAKYKIEGLESLPSAVHDTAGDCKIFGQVNVVGSGPGAASNFPTAFSSRKCQAATKDEIFQIERCFVQVIRRLKDSGFDGAELHAGHGYFLSSFLSPYMNRRTDEYGGSVENGIRIIKEIVSEAREQVSDFPILVKLNCTDHMGEQDTEWYREVAKELENIGVDAIELSSGIPECLARTEEELGFSPILNPSAHVRLRTEDNQSYHLRYAEKMDIEIPVILTGGNRDIERLESIVQADTVDFIGISRPLIREPDLPNRWMEGRGGKATGCISCNSCFYPALGPDQDSRLRCVHMEDKQLHREAQEWLGSWVENNRG
jgi:2,4-dienoyl-CoA reductase-like NADH-dependent reductase (Old Yellow Enzyme family)